MQSIFPAWRFQVADCVADGGLHGRLFVGPRRKLSDKERGTLAADLSALTIRLSRNGALADTGSGANVLDGPIQALAHLVAVLGEGQAEPAAARRRDRHDGDADARLSGAAGRALVDRDRRFRPAGLSVEIA